MKNTKVPVLEVQPHNIFLAEASLAFLTSVYPNILPVDLISHRGRLYSGDGDHRLFTAYTQGDKLISANIIDLDEKEQLAYYMAKRREQRILQLMDMLKCKRELVESVYTKETDEATIADILNTASFVQSTLQMGERRLPGVFSVADLEGRVLPTIEQVDGTFQNLAREWYKTKKEPR
jgi:hypothetical protein